MVIQRGRRRRKHRKRTLWGTLRMFASRERSWGRFSASLNVEVLFDADIPLSCVAQNSDDIFPWS
jgi:hypothetical protein